jgi:hypothetical protein
MKRDIKLPRRVVEDILKELRLVADADKSDHLSNSGDAYAHALGRCNGIAKGCVATLEVYLKRQR